MTHCLGQSRRHNTSTPVAAAEPIAGAFPPSQLIGISQLQETFSVPARRIWSGRIHSLASTVSGSCKTGYPNLQSVFPRSQFQWHIAAAADFLGTGQADLVWENTVTGQRSIWVMQNGVPQFVISLPIISTQWRIAAAADFLGTGQADLVWENTVTGQHSIWVLNNGVPANVISLPTSPIQWSIAAAADSPANGQADLVWENTVTGEHTIWILNNGRPLSSNKLPTISAEWQIVN